MAKYRKRPVVIEAWPVRELLHDARHAWNDLPTSVAEAYERGDILFLGGGVSIRTPEGWMAGNLDDLLIQGVAGELYPCKPGIFEATYGPAGD